MTLLVSQIESTKGSVTFPFVQEFVTTLYYGNILKPVLETTGTSYTSDISAVEGEAVETLVITFNSVEQVFSYLLFEQRYVIAEMLKETAALEQQKIRKPGSFKKVPVPTTPADEIIRRISRSYSNVMALVSDTTQKERFAVEDAVVADYLALTHSESTAQ